MSSKAVSGNTLCRTAPKQWVLPIGRLTWLIGYLASHFFVLWYWIGVCPAMVKMFISKEIVYWNNNNNNNLVIFLMKPHYHSVGLLELHQFWCQWEGMRIKILYRDNRNSHGLWFTFIALISKECWLWNTKMWVKKRKCQSLTGVN